MSIQKQKFLDGGYRLSALSNQLKDSKQRLG